MYLWGKVSKSQTLENPTLIPIQEQVKRLGLGDSLSVVLTTSGNVYTMGSLNKHLGSQNENEFYKIQTHEPVDSIRMGLRHVYLMSKNNVRAFGMNNFRQIDPIQKNSFIKPSIVSWIDLNQTKDIFVGPNNTFLLTKSLVDFKTIFTPEEQQLELLKKDLQELKNQYVIDQKKNQELRGKLKNLKEVISCFSRQQEPYDSEPQDPFQKMIKIFQKELQ